MRLTRKQFQQLTGKRAPRPPKPKTELGELVDLDFFIPVKPAPFKNSKQLFIRKDGRPGSTTKTEYRKLMLDAISEIRKLNLTRYPLTNVSYSLQFHISHRGQDPDNLHSATMDVLRDSGVIQGDSAMHILCCEGHSWIAVEKGREGVHVRLRGQEYRELPRAA